MANHINLVAIKYSDMVTSETRKRIDSLSSKKYFTDKAEEPDFLPLVQNVFGQYAGQVLKAGENLHHCITGISGIGKTVFMTRLMARLAQKEKRVIVFDSSDSFSKEELEKSLSKEFIQQRVFSMLFGIVPSPRQRCHSVHLQWHPMLQRKDTANEGSHAGRHCDLP